MSTFAIKSKDNGTLAIACPACSALAGADCVLLPGPGARVLVVFTPDLLARLDAALDPGEGRSAAIRDAVLREVERRERDR